MKVIEATTKKEKLDAFSVRNRVFIEEQGINPKIEYDQYDQNAIHLVGYLNEQPIAAARIRLITEQGKIQRVAILKPFRKQGYGKKLMLASEKIISQHGLQSLHLNAQIHAIPFYEAIGFEINSHPFYEAGIEHVSMNKMLN